MSELSELKARRESVIAELKEIESVIDEGRSRILEAIKSQRWYFFRDNKYILMDKVTGLLWANLDYFPYKDKVIGNFDEVSGITGWRVPSQEELWFIASNASFPFRKGGHNYICEVRFWECEGGYLDLYLYNSFSNGISDCLIPCNTSLIANTTYAQDVDPNNKIYSETERLQFTLDLFTHNNLWPKFDDDEITELYGQIFIRKPELEQQLQELDAQIAPLMAVRVLSSEFDYTAPLAQYDIPAISSSVIKYFQALQKWTTDLMSMLEEYEREKQPTISQFTAITLQLSKKYEDSPALSREENEFLRGRIEFFRRKLSLGMHRAKEKILSVKRQADELEDRVDNTDSLTELAAIQAEPRADFPLVAENTARIIMNALLKIEYFESHRDFVMNAVKILTDWTDNYRVFMTALCGQLKDSCVEDTIDARIWDVWLKDWQALRFRIERKLQPLLEWGLAGDIPAGNNDLSVPERIIAALAEYKSAVDKFYLDERKGVYQKFAFQAGGNLQDKFETESLLYKCSSEFQRALQEIIFDCARPADRIFILKLADDLLDVQIDEILAFVADEGLDKISAEILEGFAELKAKNYDVYLSDAKAYGDELARREKEYNKLMFKMRSNLQKGEAQ